MSLGEYKCNECGKVSEYLDPMNCIINERDCEDKYCGGLSKRIMSAPNVRKRNHSSPSDSSENTAYIVEVPVLEVFITRRKEDSGKDFN